MATRGVRPKPSHLHLVAGTRNVTRHGTENELREKVERAQAQFGKIERPKGLKGHALACWKEMIEPCGWLDGSRKVAAVAFCELYAEWKDAPRMFPASKHGQMRAYMSELGLTDERNRIGSDEKPKDEFFDAADI